MNVRAEYNYKPGIECEVGAGEKGVLGVFVESCQIQETLWGN